MENVLPQAAQLPGTGDSFTKVDFWKKFCPRQRSCSGQVTSSKTNIDFLEKVLPQAAQLPQTCDFFNNKSISGKNLPQAAQLPRIGDFFENKPIFKENVLPQAVQLPRTGDFFKKNRNSGNSSAPGSAAAPDR